MKFSEAWLRNWVDPDISTDELVSQLTMAGLEVDAVEPAAPGFSGVVIGLIEAVEPHPDAEKLRVCKVSDGESSLQIVCGASNAAVGMKVPLAKVGAQLPGGLEIKQARLRGVESSGMLCGASELGLEDIVDGLLELPVDAPEGEDLREYLGLDDSLIEVDLTPNRGDCLSMVGIAREVGVLTRSDVTVFGSDAIKPVVDDSLPVSLSAPDYCPRYAGRVIRDIDLSRPAPLWLREMLRRSGLRSIDAVVDITNYVLLAYGQPMHAFDLEKIDQRIDVRMAEAGETIELLDGSTAELGDEHLVIADNSRALAVAGIMGGAHSAVSSTTRHIFLESAFFEPDKHAGKARGLGLHTDSSHRFERGVDLARQQRGIEVATYLLLDIVGGRAGPVILQEDPDFAARPQPTITLRESQIERVLGFSMQAEQVNDLLTRLELAPERTKEGWQVTVPSHRFDLAIEADLLEELARVYGYDNLPVDAPLAPTQFSLQPEARQPLLKLKALLNARGYSEAITYSFIDPAVSEAFYPGQSPVALSNPIASDMSVMRLGLVPGLLKAATHNLSRQVTRLKLFESGLRFVPGENGLAQQSMLAGLIVGERLGESWLSKREASAAPGSKPDPFDFFDLKGDVQALLSLGLAGRTESLRFSPLGVESGIDYLHPGQSALVQLGDQNLGVLGQLHPKLAQTLDISGDIWVFELQLDLISQKKVPEFKELSKFPEVRRDQAIIIDRSVTVGDVVASVNRCAPEQLVELVVFDQYMGEGVAEGKQSIALGLTWQHAERTLNDEEVTTLTNTVVEALKKEFAISLR